MRKRLLNKSTAKCPPSLVPGTPEWGTCYRCDEFTPLWAEYDERGNIVLVCSKHRSGKPKPKRKHLKCA